LPCSLVETLDSHDRRLLQRDAKPVGLDLHRRDAFRSRDQHWDHVGAGLPEQLERNPRLVGRILDRLEPVGDDAELLVEVEALQVLGGQPESRERVLRLLAVLAGRAQVDLELLDARRERLQLDVELLRGVGEPGEFCRRDARHLGRIHDRIGGDKGRLRDARHAGDDGRDADRGQQ
jgi:hypothetical protein